MSLQHVADNDILVQVNRTRVSTGSTVLAVCEDPVRVVFWVAASASPIGSLVLMELRGSELVVVAEWDGFPRQTVVSSIQGRLVATSWFAPEPRTWSPLAKVEAVELTKAGSCHRSALCILASFPYALHILDVAPTASGKVLLVTSGTPLGYLWNPETGDFVGLESSRLEFGVKSMIGLSSGDTLCAVSREYGYLELYSSANADLALPVVAQLATLPSHLAGLPLSGELSSDGGTVMLAGEIASSTGESEFRVLAAALPRRIECLAASIERPFWLSPSTALKPAV